MRYHLMVKGKVQGVGYRYFVVTAGKNMGLTGWVRNCSNGDVECEAQGKKIQLEAFIERLESGHSWARIDRIEKQEMNEKSEEREFEIAY